MDNARIRQRLEESRTTLLARRERLARHTEHRDAPLPQDFAEQATERENEETLFALKRDLDEQLPRVERALRRLDDGTYRDCQHCGADIGTARLEALPTADLCITCAQAAS
jgi:RNA polymerase-binding protein DksA